MTQIPYELNNTLNRLCIDCEFVSDNSQHYIYRIHDKFLISNFWVIPNEELIKHTENSKTSYLEFKLISEMCIRDRYKPPYLILTKVLFFHLFQIYPYS